MLKQAKASAVKVIDSLLPYATQGIPIVGLEPSCIFTLKDEYPDLVPSYNANEIANACLTIDSFLAERLKDNTLSWRNERKVTPVYFHTHCHQKALEGTTATARVLQSVPGLEVKEIVSGCCGLAGSFGYEQEHYAMSMQIGENSLFPAIRETDADSILVANGMSCRSQISHGTKRQALHLMQLLAQALS
jgi:Fe-S oxidoreductase